MERFAKTIMTKYRCATRIFQGKVGGEERWFVELWHFDKDFVKSARKGRPEGKYFRAFSPRYF